MSIYILLIVQSNSCISISISISISIRPLSFEKCKTVLEGVRTTGQKVKVMISTLKEQAGETEDPDLQVKISASANVS